MRIIVLAKYAKPKKNLLKRDKEEEEEDDGLDAHTRRIIGKYDEEEEEQNPAKIFKEMFSEENLEIYYKPYSLDTKTIHDFYPADDGSTVLITDYAGSLPIKMLWNDWLAAWERHTGEAIYILGEELKTPPLKKEK